LTAGLCIWVVFEVAFLLLGIAPNSYPMILLFYALRGFGYPLFAFGFLVWVTAATPPGRLGTAVGWFWFAFTGGLPTIGSFVASLTVPRIGPYPTLWLSLGLVVLGGLVALLGVREPTGRHRLAPPGDHPVATLLSSVTIAWKEPKTAIGCVVRVINTAPQFGFLVCLPI
jgi:MFS family permease